MNVKMLALCAAMGFGVTAVAASFSGEMMHTRASAVAAPTKITGDYVEARTASVFAGACHFNGEYVTVGKDAVMAWDFSAGSYHGVDLKGVKAVAAVTSEENLDDATAAHKTELAIDPSASMAQVSALKALLAEKCGKELGTITAVRREPVNFVHGENGYAVQAGDFAQMVVDYRADDSCCKQPNSVWYTPLSPLDHRKVGYTEIAGVKGTVSDPWERRGEDSAFYGAFTF